MVAKVGKNLILISQSLNSLNSKKTQKVKRIYNLPVGHKHHTLQTEVAKGMPIETIPQWMLISKAS